MTVDLLFDARHVKASGIGVYSQRQISLMASWGRENDLRIALLGSEKTIGGLGAGIEVISPSAEASMYTAGEQMVLSSSLRQIRPRAFWTPHYPLPVSSLGPQMFVTIHDVLHAERKSNGGVGFARRRYARAMIQMALKRSREVFVPSLATKSEIERLFHDSPKLRVAPMRIDPAWTDPIDASQMPSDLPDRYLLYVGNVKRHKNLLLLLRAFESIKDKFDVDLVLAGGAANVRNEDARAFAHVQSLGSRVHLTGNLPFEALRTVVAGAECLVMPSLYEGVGLPPLEAMAVRTPVLASDIPSLRETCGNAAAYFDPRNDESLINCIVGYLGSSDARERMVLAGTKRLKERENSIDPMLALRRITAFL